MNKEIRLEDLPRPIRKSVEHLQDALFHVEQSDLPKAAKVELDGLIQEAGRVLAESINKITTLEVRS